VARAAARVYYGDTTESAGCDGSTTRRPNVTAVKYAYDFILPSYQWAVLRFDAAISRIHALMMCAAMITIGAPLIGRASAGLRFSSLWFIVAIVLFATLMILGVIARESGALMLDSAGVLHEKVLDLGETEFKHYAVYYARQDLEHNRHLIEMKSLYGTMMAVLLFAEMLAIVVWLVTGRPGLADVAL
jgi:hypothetical protein